MVVEAISFSPSIGMDDADFDDEIPEYFVKIVSNSFSTEEAYDHRR